ncbi:MAG TPA: DNA internalization-related competence protein ComEC/Rec2 [bacterium (Candidatus Stahlbacteria)]|nr:DNA internalization-related competence protein ComEC/Rec2 [Candidatus Stahlbacteria bacterium]
MHQPALLSFVFFVAGIICGYLFDIPLPYIIVALFGLCLVYLAFFIVSRTHRVFNYLISILLILGGLFLYEIRTSIFSPNHIKRLLELNDKIEFICRIVKDPEIKSNRTILECVADTVICKGEEFPIRGKVLVDLRFPTHDFEYGQRIKVYGYLWCPDFPRNPKEFDYRGYLKRKDIYGIMTVWDYQDITILAKGQGNPILSHISLPIKRFIERTIDDNLSGDQGALLKGVIIGERGLISNRVKNMFANTGVLHVLAVSGLHVGIIATILFIVLQVLRVPSNFSLLLTGFALLIYAFIVDLRYSVVRAALMTVFMMGALASERNTRLLNIIACAGLLILFINPQSLFDTSFQLSFVTVGSIIYLTPRIYPLFGFIKDKQSFADRWLVRPFVISLCAQAGSAPLVAYYFFRLPIISIVANLIVIPLVGASIALGFTMTFLNILPWKLPAHLFACTSFASTTLTLKVVDFFNSIPYGHMWVHKPCILFLVFYYGALFLAANTKTSARARKALIYVTLIAANVFCWTQVYRICRPKLTVTFLDVGYGDATFVQFPNGKKVLIDCGSWSKTFDAGKRIVAPFLRSHGIHDLDFVIITKPKIQYAGGLRYILKNFKVKEIVGYGAPYSSWAYLDLLRYINYKDIPYRVCEAGDKIDEIGLTILRSGKDGSSLAFKIEYGKISFLFAEELQEWKENKVTILKVPSHGSKRYSTPEFVSSVTPKIAVVSVGRNPYGHPNPGVLSRYEEVGAKIFRTDEVGAVIVETDGRSVWVNTAKNLYESESLKQKIFRYMGLTL